MKFLLALVTLLSLSHFAPAEPVNDERDLSKYFGDYTAAFVLYDAKQDKCLRFHPELCRERSSPCSTFKIPNSLIALETGVADGPDFKIAWDGQKRMIEEWNQDQTLRSAYRYSAVWYYQELARRTGKHRMDEMVAKFRYGNGDTSGGLDQFWLESTLKISPDEQVDFLRRLQTRQLPVSARALDQLLDIMTLPRKGPAVYRGKTGSGWNPETKKYRIGWWVGSVTTAQGEYYFATCIKDGQTAWGKEARRITEAILADLQILPPEE